MGHESTLSTFFRRQLVGVGFILLCECLDFAKADVAQPLTGQELAQHLGVLNWTTSINLDPGTYRISLLEITDGKVGTMIGYWEPGSGPKGDRLAIMISSLKGKPEATLVLGSGITWGGYIDSDHAFWINPTGTPSYATPSLPASIGIGVYALGGAFDTIYTGPPAQVGEVAPFKDPKEVKDFRSGFALQIEPWSKAQADAWRRSH